MIAYENEPALIAARDSLVREKERALEGVKEHAILVPHQLSKGKANLLPRDGKTVDGDGGLAERKEVIFLHDQYYHSAPNNASTFL